MWPAVFTPFAETEITVEDNEDELGFVELNEVAPDRRCNGDCDRYEEFDQFLALI